VAAGFHRSGTAAASKSSAGEETVAAAASAPARGRRGIDRHGRPSTGAGEGRRIPGKWTSPCPLLQTNRLTELISEDGGRLILSWVT